MLVKSPNFVISMSSSGDYPGRGLPEVAIVGKSNVGKSSLINRLTGRGNLAKVSGTPGKTRLINIFDINHEFMLVDLPGYGFAKVSQDEKTRWGGMIEGYLSGDNHLKLVLALADLRHAPTADDVIMSNYLRHYGIPFIVVATKADKLSKAARGRNIPVICRTLGVQPWQVVPVSSVDGTGCEALLSVIERQVFPDEPEVNICEE